MTGVNTLEGDSAYTKGQYYIGYVLTGGREHTTCSVLYYKSSRGGKVSWSRNYTYYPYLVINSKVIRWWKRQKGYVSESKKNKWKIKKSLYNRLVTGLKVGWNAPVLPP